jgi:hypothetical protein
VLISDNALSASRSMAGTSAFTGTIPNNNVSTEAETASRREGKSRDLQSPRCDDARFFRVQKHGCPRLILSLGMARSPPHRLQRTRKCDVLCIERAMTTRVPKHLPISSASVLAFSFFICDLPSFLILSRLVQPQERVLPRRKSCTLTILCVPQSQMQRQSPSPFELTSLTRSMATSLPKRCQAISRAAITGFTRPFSMSAL